MAANFDTHAAVKRLTGTGMPEAQAETIVRTVSELHARADVATKTDIEQLRQGTKADLEQLRQGTKADLEQHRQGTKADLEQLRQGTKADLEQLRQALDNRVDRKLAELKAELMRWMFGTALAQVVLIVALVRLTA